MEDVWSDWIPGVLSKRQLGSLAKRGLVTGVTSKAIDESAIDLHLSQKCYCLERGSVKPFGEGFLRQAVKHGLVAAFERDRDGAWSLERETTYLFPLRERLRGLRGGEIWGQATAKSSVGRVDVLARLVVDGMYQYERFTPHEVSTSGLMFLEVTPFTFRVRVRPGDSLSQLRLFYGNPEECELTGDELGLTCLGRRTSEYNLTVDLNPVSIFGVSGCGFIAWPTAENDAIPLWDARKGAKPDPSRSWRLVRRDRYRRLLITKNRFYILRSKQRLRVPRGIAVYARATDEEIGEMRIHYAGFAHPLFGWSRSDGKKGTPLIFEVRGHSVNVSLRDDEVLARLRFFRMSEEPEANRKLKGKPRKRVGSRSYNEQELQLSKYFANWSSRPTLASLS